MLVREATLPDLWDTDLSGSFLEIGIEGERMEAGKFEIRPFSYCF